MMYVVYGITVIAAVLFAGYLGGLRAAQILEDHKQKEHKKKGRSGPKLPNHVNCRSKLPPEFYTVLFDNNYSKEDLEKLDKKLEAGQFIITVPIDKNDLKARIENLEDRLEAHKIEAKGNYDRLFKYVDHNLDKTETLVNKINSGLDFETLSKIEEFTEQLIEEKPPICKHKYKQLILDFYGEEEYKEACIYEVLKEGKLDMEEGALCYDES